MHPDINIVFDHENEERTEGVGDAGNKVHRRSVHVGTFKIDGIVCSLSHALRSDVEAMEITRAEGTGRLLKRFDFIAREISNFAARAGETSPRKNGKKGERAIASVTYDIRSPDTFCPLASDFRFIFSIPLASFPSICPSLFSISRSGRGRLHSHRMANWTRNFILPDERPPRPER